MNGMDADEEDQLDGTPSKSCETIQENGFLRFRDLRPSRSSAVELSPWFGLRSNVDALSRLISLLAVRGAVGFT